MDSKIDINLIKNSSWVRSSSARQISEETYFFFSLKKKYDKYWKMESINPLGNSMIDVSKFECLTVYMISILASVIN